MQTLTLVRGLPGSGKSSFAGLLASNNKSVVLSADDYFTKNGVYSFDPQKLPQAHEYCQIMTKVQIENFCSVIVANTFSQRWEMEPYIRIAKEKNIRLHIVDVFDGGLTNEELSRRNVHNVPLDVIATMRNRWEHDWKEGNPLPPWER
jgi:predicted kinase